MNARTRTILAAVAAFGFLTAGAVFAADGTAHGTLTVNGKTTTVSHAYARAVPGFFDKSKEDVEVILSDVPLEGKQLEDEFERIHMADAGKLHAFEITIDADGKAIGTNFRHNGFKGPSPSGLSSADVFTKKVFDGKIVEGSYKSAKPGEFFGNTYSFDVAFRAAITRKAKPVPPSAAESASASKSPQAKVYLEFLAAVQREDLGAMRKLMTRDQGAHLDSPDAKEMVGMIKAMAATDVKVLKVVETGDKAELTVTGKQNGNTANGTVQMAREGGAWKVQKEEWQN